MRGVLHDMICSDCGNIDYDVICEGQFRKTCLCGGQMDIMWKRRAQSASVHSSERAAIWYNTATGKHATPGLNNVPMPERYRKAGYERREFHSLRDLDSYCKSENLLNHAANYDNSGRAYDDD